jgi:hypothetical protein
VPEAANMKIKGTLPDPKFNSEWVFLAPLTVGQPRQLIRCALKNNRFPLGGERNSPGESYPHAADYETRDTGTSGGS